MDLTDLLKKTAKRREVKNVDSRSPKRQKLDHLTHTPRDQQETAAGSTLRDQQSQAETDLATQRLIEKLQADEVAAKRRSETENKLSRELAEKMSRQVDVASETLAKQLSQQWASSSEHASEALARQLSQQGSDETASEELAKKLSRTPWAESQITQAQSSTSGDRYDISGDHTLLNPDLRSLFLKYDNLFFEKKLGMCEVKWSKRMTLCAGVCSYEGAGGLCSIRLSQPVLQYRPTSDTVDTLIHEMIHAYLFVTDNDRDRDGHGPNFKKHMNRINDVTKCTKISIYHEFHDEVDIHRKHVWKCNGPCQKKKPYFGLVKRAMNRAPGPRDPWWQKHVYECGGTYIKYKEPKDYKPPKGKQENISAEIQRQRDETKKANGIKKAKKKMKAPKPKPRKPKVEKPKGQPDLSQFFGNSKPPPKRPAPKPTSAPQASTVSCPVCLQEIPVHQINVHLNNCLCG